MGLFDANGRRRLGTGAVAIAVAAIVHLVALLYWIDRREDELSRIASYEPAEHRVRLEKGTVIDATLAWDAWPRRKGNAVLSLVGDRGTCPPDARAAGRHPLIARTSARDQATGASRLDSEPESGWALFRGQIGCEIARIRPGGQTRLQVVVHAVPPWAEGLGASLEMGGARDDALWDSVSHRGLVEGLLAILHGAVIIVFLVVGIGLLASVEKATALRAAQRE